MTPRAVYCRPVRCCHAVIGPIGTTLEKAALPAGGLAQHHRFRLARVRFERSATIRYDQRSRPDLHSFGSPSLPEARMSSALVDVCTRFDPPFATFSAASLAAALPAVSVPRRTARADPAIPSPGTPKRKKSTPPFLGRGVRSRRFQRPRRAVFRPSVINRRDFSNTFLPARPPGDRRRAGRSRRNGGAASLRPPGRRRIRAPAPG